LNHLV